MNTIALTLYILVLYPVSEIQMKCDRTAFEIMENAFEVTENASEIMKMFLKISNTLMKS